MARRRVMVGDQEVEIPDFNFKIMPIILILFAIWFLFVTVYSVGPDEVGVIRTFGAQTRVEGSGINIKFPAPIETVIKPKVTEVKRIEIGFRSIGKNQYQTIERERWLRILSFARKISGPIRRTRAVKKIHYMLVI